METEKERRPVLTTADACPRCKPLVDALNNEILMLEEKLAAGRALFHEIHHRGGDQLRQVIATWRVCACSSRPQ